MIYEEEAWKFPYVTAPVFIFLYELQMLFLILDIRAGDSERYQEALLYDWWLEKMNKGLKKERRRGVQKAQLPDLWQRILTRGKGKRGISTRMRWRRNGEGGGVKVAQRRQKRGWPKHTDAPCIKTFLYLQYNLVLRFLYQGKSFLLSNFSLSIF